jgi:hypothetical protein
MTNFYYDFGKLSHVALKGRPDVSFPQDLGGQVDFDGVVITDPYVLSLAVYKHVVPSI